MGKKYKIINAVGSLYPDEAKIVLTKCGDLVMVDRDQISINHSIKDADVLIIQLGVEVRKAQIDMAKNLKIIATATTGLDHIDVDYALSRGIKVISLRGENDFLSNISSTAELAFGLMISLSRNITSSFDNVKAGFWKGDKFVGRVLRGKTLGIVGLGRLGSMMAEYANSFGMDILAFDLYADKNKFEYYKCRKVDFDYLISNSDYISIHLPLTEETVDMFDKRVFGKIKEGSYLINTSRGEIVNEKDLIEALDKKKILGYAADVISGEPHHTDKNLLLEYARKNGNILLTPHIGGTTLEDRKKTDLFIANKIKKLLNC